MQKEEKWEFGEQVVREALEIGHDDFMEQMDKLFDEFDEKMETPSSPY